ncbi:AMP-binding protein [Mycobacterium montefiorense]|uniref:AMP-binding protein n=1 Tax=Mycobacterium montefiorense TaxID=154654 RepID=UPI0021DEF9F6|nr:AMP-binding protein [Mycobacterium montefiorense]MCV7428630.1 AMP-binding protein [Mycobacterium montefiorense]GLE53850.1 acyl-CoA synthetase [Mycobacterium montefiorense]
MPNSLRQLLTEREQRTPDAVAITVEQTNITWRELGHRSRRVAAALARDGAADQSRVGYLGKNGLPYFEMLFGCGLANAVFAPLNWRLATTELAAILSDSDARLLVVDPGVTVPADLDTAARIVELGSDYQAWLGPATDPLLTAEPEHIAFQLYTSGTTGVPKGAMFANGTNFRILTEEIAGTYPLAPGDASLVMMPLFHMGGLAWALAGLASGARNVIVRDFNADVVLDTIRDESIAAAFCVLAMLAALCQSLEAHPRRLPLKRMVYAGAPISPSALRQAMRLLDCDFIQIYGLTEATGSFAELPAEEHHATGERAHLLRSAGRPYPWVEVRVVSPRSGADVADGDIGEIWTRSDQNFVGYWKRPEETEKTLTAEGWLRTGDLGYQDAEGRLFLVDRANDLIIAGGENIYPGEVENVLSEFDGIEAVAVIGVPSQRWGETVKAIITVRPGRLVEASDLIAFAHTRLAGFKCPTSVEVIDAMPLTATGKIQKARLREPFWVGHDRRIS